MCAVWFLVLTFGGKLSDKLAEITRVDPKRGRRISIMILVACLGLSKLNNRWAANWDRTEWHSLDHELTLTHLVQPVYPPLAKQARVQGAVRFSATISTQGQVMELKLIEGNPLLVPAAQDAAKQWIYKPPTTEGRPAKVKTEIDVDFRLDSPSSH